MPTSRLPLNFDIQSRTSSTEKDSRLVNIIIEDDEIVKRPGYVLETTTGAGQGQGLFSWNNQIIACNANNIYSVVGINVTPLGSIVGSQLPLSFSASSQDTYLVFHNGTTLSYLNKTDNPPVIYRPLDSTQVVGATIDSRGGWYGNPVAVTMTIVTSLVNHTAHGLVTGQGVSYTTTGALPTGVISGATYAVVYVDANSYTLVQTGVGGAAVLMSGSQSGTHSETASPTVTFSAGTTTTALGTIVLSNHQVSSIVMSNLGSSTTQPSIVISDPSPLGTQAGGSPMPYLDTPTVPSTGGSRYISAPNVYGTGHLGTDPTPIGYSIIDSSGVVTSFTVTHYPDFLITGVPISVVFDSPLNQTAQATANMSATISGTWAYGIVYLDGSFYIMDKLTGTIYGSNLNDPTAVGWNALNKIIAGRDSDEMVAIASHLNYIVAFGFGGTEFFYDAGNPGPSSPLDVNKSAYIEIGCANPYTIASAEQTLIWVGTSPTIGRSVYLLEGLSPVKVSTRYIDKFLNSIQLATSTRVRSYCFKIAGHTLYVLSLPDTNYTFVFDLDEHKWYQWTSQSGDTTGIDGTETYFKPTFFSGNYEYEPKVYLQDDDNGNIYIMYSTYYNDAGNKIYFRAVSPIIDSGTTKRKFYKRVEVVGDKVSGTLKIRKFDDDYSTPSTYRTVLLSDKRPILYQNGSTRRRAWEVFSSDNIPIRLKALEFDFDIGEEGE